MAKYNASLMCSNAAISFDSSTVIRTTASWSYLEAFALQVLIASLCSIYGGDGMPAIPVIDCSLRFMVIAINPLNVHYLFRSQTVNLSDFLKRFCSHPSHLAQFRLCSRSSVNPYQFLSLNRFSTDGERVKRCIYALTKFDSFSVSGMDTPQHDEGSKEVKQRFELFDNIALLLVTSTKGDVAVATFWKSRNDLTFFWAKNTFLTNTSELNHINGRSNTTGDCQRRAAGTTPATPVAKEHGHRAQRPGKDHSDW